MTNDVTKDVDQPFRSLARHYFDTLGAATRLPGSVIDTLRLFEDSTGLRRMLKEMNRGSDLLRAASGPLDDWKRLGVFDAASPLQKEMERMHKLSAEYDAHFRLPQALEIARLSEQLHAAGPSPLLQQVNEIIALQRATDTMHSPRLHEHNAVRSFSGFAELQGIGHALGAMPAFGDTLTSALRSELGDWRDPITWPEPIFSDFLARSAFYVERGFNSALTDFPAPAFRESVVIAGLVRPLPPLFRQQGEPVLEADDPEEEGFVRTNQAHDRLQRFEARLRTFIDEAMSAALGTDWPKRRLPNGLCDKWLDKKRKAEERGGQALPLIAYADFTDYEQIICRPDNWREVFGRTFERPESVRESFQRLYPIRICTMHARPITQDDELFLYVEVYRLIGVIE